MEYIIEMNNITKQFQNFKANDDITFKVLKGEIHALLGENGAGKSTLMSVLFGLYKPEKGDIVIKGKKVKINNPIEANNLGIGMVHQHFKLVHNFTVLENILLGHEDTKAGFLKNKKAKEKIKSLIEKYNFNLDLNAYISDITVGMQQKVEILKMLYCDNDILIFDEPTAVLIPQEIEELMQIMQNLAKEGKSIIFITHKLNEIKAICNRCTVIRKGKCIGTVNVAETTKETLSEMMVGRKIDFILQKYEIQSEEIILNIKNLSLKSKETKKLLLKNISFNIKKGEIVCIAGVDGNGQTELIHAITGLIPFDEGSIFFKDKDFTYKSIRQKCIAGFAHIPEDRHKHGLVLDYTLKENLILQSYYTKKFQKFGFLKFNEISNYAKYLIEKFDIRSPKGESSIVRSMSGGNQQKAVIARELDRNPDLIIAMQPVRGLDVGAIEYIHKQILNERDKGKAILLVSMELEEVMALSDRILVMYQGEIVANVTPKEITIKELGLYMAGSKRSTEYEKQ